MQVPKGTESGVRKGKRSLLHTHCKCSIETIRNSVKVKLGINVMTLAKSRIGLEVSVIGRGCQNVIKPSLEGNFILLYMI